MAEVAGLVLGGIPIALWALEQYRQPVKAYWKYNVTLSTLKDNLFIQQEQLHTTLRLIGLNNPSTTELQEHLRDKYPTRHKGFLSIIGHMDVIIKRLMENLEIDLNGKPLWTDNRTQWEWRKVKRSFGTKQRNEMISELQYWNNALKNCFEKPEVPAEDEDSQVQELLAQFSPKQSDSIRDHARAIHGALKQAWNCVLPCSHLASLDLHWQPGQSNRTSAMDVFISYQDPLQDNSTVWKKVHVVVEDYKGDVTSSVILENSPPCIFTSATPLPASSTTPPASTARKSIFNRFHKQPSKQRVEMMVTPSGSPSSQPSNTQSSKATTTIGSIPGKLGKRVLCLCSYIKSEEPHTSAMDYLPDPDQRNRRKFNLSFAHETEAGILDLLPLKDAIFSHQALQFKELPSHLVSSAKQRYGIAAGLAWAVLHLSGTPWLGEDWYGSQVNLALQSKPGDREFFSKNPCITHSFGMEPPVQVLPLAKRFANSQIRNKTLFALSILLMELCLNKPFDELQHLDSPRHTDSTSPDDYNVANDRLDEVYNQAGNLYGYAVQRCLRCEFPGRDVTKSFDFASFRREFYNVVVAPLQATYTKHL